MKFFLCSWITSWLVFTGFFGFQKFPPRHGLGPHLSIPQVHLKVLGRKRRRQNETKVVERDGSSNDNNNTTTTTTNNNNNNNYKYYNYTSIDPKQQQTMFPRRSCTMKNSLGVPFLRETKKKRRETSPGTLAGTRRKEEITMEHIATILRRQAPQPFLEPGTRTWWWNRMPEDYRDNPRNHTRNQKDWRNDDGTECQNTWNQKSWWNKTVSWKSWEPHSAPQLFGQQTPEP